MDVLAIEAPEQSSSFRATHDAVEQLAQFDDFGDADLARLIHSYTTNAQIQLDEDKKRRQEAASATSADDDIPF